MPTVEEVALTLQYLADLKGPDLPHPRVGGVKHIRLHRGVGRPRGEDKLAWIAFHVLFQTQTAYLQRQAFTTQLFKPSFSTTSCNYRHRVKETIFNMIKLLKCSLCSNRTLQVLHFLHQGELQTFKPPLQ